MERETPIPHTTATCQIPNNKKKKNNFDYNKNNKNE